METNMGSVGFARLDITPPLGIHLAGYFEERLADRVIDPLYVSAVAFGYGEKRALLLACDTLIFWGNVSYEWPGILAKTLEVPEEAIFITHSHTHTGPMVGNEKRDEQYDAWLLRRLCDAGQLALDDLMPVTDVRTVETETQGLTFTRRFRAKDGHVQTWATNPDTLLGHSSEADQTLRLVRISRGEGSEIALVNFQTHPDMIGGCGISADFPGVLRQIVEKEQENVYCVFLQGAEGELVPTDALAPQTRQTTNWKRTPFAYEKRCVPYGTELARLVLNIFEDVKSTDKTGLSFGKYQVTAKSKRDSAKVPEAKRLLELIESGRGEEVTPKWNLIALKAHCRALIMLDREQIDEIHIPVTALAFCGVALLGIAGEPFSQMGARIRAASPYQTTCVCSLTNGWRGYYADAQSYDEGGYEPSNCWMAKGVAETLEQASIDLLNQI